MKNEKNLIEGRIICMKYYQKLINQIKNISNQQFLYGMAIPITCYRLTSIIFGISV
ncbi:hypothetical protein SAMN05421677_11329 [Halobacillus aidingensis]|uniref:Uncharacterized protein n=1 Tax=Halobacillus aidingensis TaxID=240303 RepID=A0A1H0QKW2_HALAD|nr:hypothetical protein SAMN05421677_11329 [Halobacillus aidingensis]